MGRPSDPVGVNGVGLAATGYAAYVGLAWYRYGNAAAPLSEEIDALLDDFMPEYEVAERHHVRVAAPADITLSAAMETDLQKSKIIRGIFNARALVLGALPPRARRAISCSPNGVLFRGGAEKEIRKKFVEEDLIEAVIGLPQNLFYGASIPACILVMRPNLTNQAPNPSKPADRRGQVLFINADAEFHAGRAQNYLRPEHVEKVVSTFDRYQDIPGYARRVSLEEISSVANDFNLNIRRYVDNSSRPAPIRLTPPEGAGVYLPSGWLLWVRAGGTLAAQRLDLAYALLTGEPTTLADGVGAVSVAGTGRVAYRAGASNRRQLTWVDRSGTARGIVGDPDDNLRRDPRVSRPHLVFQMSCDFLDWICRPVWMGGGVSMIGRSCRGSGTAQPRRRPGPKPQAGRVDVRGTAAYHAIPVRDGTPEEGKTTHVRT